MLARLETNMFVMILRRTLFLPVFLVLSACTNLSEQASSNSSLRTDPVFEIEGFPVPGSFEVERIELETEGVSRSKTYSKDDAFYPQASIQYKGFGSLVGHWTLDGRIIEPFIVNLNRGSLVKVRTRRAISLSALSSGRHKVGMVFSAPTLDFRPPTLEFFIK